MAHDTRQAPEDAPPPRRWWELQVEFFHLRLLLLSAVFVGVVAFAIGDVRSRRARNEWKRTLNVALVLVRVGDVDEGAARALARRAPYLETVLAREMHRYRASPERPVAVSVLGPIDAPPAPMPEDDGLLALAKQAWDVHCWRAPIDDELDLDADAFDSRVYVVLRPPSKGPLFVEGSSEQGGRIGMTDVELDRSMVDFALFVSAHELLHTLGATDKVDAAGHTLGSLGPPPGEELIEVMGHGRPLPNGADAPPDSLDALWVSRATAEELGW